MSAIGGGVKGPGPLDPDEGTQADAAPGPEPAAAAAAPVVRGGQTSEAFRARTALQNHAAFFDLDKDGMVSVKETDQAMRSLGLAGISSAPTALAINAGLGRATSGRLLDVSVENIHKGKHAGDTGILDEKGNFVPAKFEELWKKFDADKDGALNQAEIDRMIASNNDNAGLSSGVVASRGEWYLLLDLAGQKNPRGERTLTRERVQSFYDGTLFPKIASERAAEAARSGRDPLHGDVNAGLPGLARNLGGILAGSAAGAKAGDFLTRVEDAARTFTAPLGGAMLAVCPRGAKP